MGTANITDPHPLSRYGRLVSAQRTHACADPSRAGHFSSMISRTTLRLVREATAFRIVRIDLAVRPCFPITRPRSSLATRSSSTDAVSPCVSFTSTASGLLTNCRARNWTSSFMAGSVEPGRGALGGGWGCFDKLPDGVTGSRAGFQPVRNQLFVHRDFRWIEGGVVGADLIDKTTVAG